MQNFTNPRARSPAAGHRQLIRREKSRLSGGSVKVIRLRVAAEIADDVTCDILARARIEKESMQIRLAGHGDIASFLKFAGEGHQCAFVPLDGASGQLPASDESMSHKKNPSLLVEEKASDAEAG
ncbi:MAG: hypothetical protein WDN46_05605 [Methylocella sp.]